MPAGSRPPAGRTGKGGPSKLRGVIWHKSNGKWEARIYEAGKQRFLGYHTSEVAAARAYDARAVALHGAAAKVNFPAEHEATRHNPPAPKPGHALTPQPASGDSAPVCAKRRSPNHSTPSSATARPGRRSDDGDDDDEDYVPCRADGAPVRPICCPSARHIALAGSPAPQPDSAEQSCDSDFEDEQRLEMSAVQVLASLRSSSSDDNTAWPGSLPRRLQLHSAPDSPPASSTGASPAPLPKSRVWEPGQLWRAESAGAAQSSCLPPALEAAAAAAEQCAESLATPAPLPPRKRRAELEASLDGSCSETDELEATPLAARKWAPAAWEQRQAKRPRVPAEPQPVRAAPLQQGRGGRGPAGRAPGAKPSRGSSRFRGVSWCEKGQKWRALIWDGHRQHFLGHFKSEEEGARAYDRALLQRRKKDGALNFPLADYAQLLATLPGPPASAFLRPGVPPVAQGSSERAPAAPVVEEPRPPPAQRPRRAAARCLTAEQIDGELGGEDSGDEGSAAGVGLQRSRAAHGSSRFRGVSWSVRSGKWRAQMWLGAKVLHLGFFDDEREAARAYDAALARHKGPGAAGAGANFAPPACDGGPPAEDGGEPGFRGVRWHERSGRWEARIFDGCRQVSLGHHDSEQAAALAWDAAALRLRGPAAATNFVPPTPPALGGQADAGGLVSWGTKKRRNS